MIEREKFNGHNVYSLSEVAMSIHNVIARNYTRPYYIKAEILKLNYYPHSGHCYPELVEREGNKITAEMRAIIWSSNFESINRRFMTIVGEPLKENLSVLVLATIQYSPKHGLALHIEDVEPSYTLGELERNRQEVIAKLKKENIFDANKKLKIPLLPQKIAVISVETSKGYSDFINTLNNNDKSYTFHTELFPSILQGEKAISGITSQLNVISQRIDDFDCVVIVRGGGGDVGLSCYDDYQLASTVATFPLPVLTGIGHSTNTTICDLVAYKNFITPTDVAFFLIKAFSNFDEQIQTSFASILSSISTIIENNSVKLNNFEANFKLKASKLLTNVNKELNKISTEILFNSKELIRNYKQVQKEVFRNIVEATTQQIKNSNLMLSNCFDRILAFTKQNLNRQKQDCDVLESKLRLLSPQNILKRGYSITLKNGKAIVDNSELQPGDKLETILYNGKVSSVVAEKK